MNILGDLQADLRLLSFSRLNFFDHENWLSFCQRLVQNTTVTTLIFASPIDGSLPILTEISNSHIRELSVTCQSPEEWRMLGEMLLRNPSIIKCTISGAPPTSKSGFLDSLASNPNLQKLFILDSNYSDYDIIKLNGALRANSTLEELKIERKNSIYGWLHQEKKSLEINETLKRVKYHLLDSLDQYNIFCNSLMMNQRLQELKLYGPSFPPDPLIKYIDINANLTVLSLTCKNIDFITREFITALQSNTSITDLTLKSMPSQRAPPNTIEELFIVNKTIKKFKYKAALTSKAIDSICQSLHKNDTLTDLTLNDGSTFITSYSPFKELFKHNNTLQSLRIDGAISVEDLVQVLRLNSSLTRIRVSIFFVSEQNIQTLLQTLQTNFKIMSLKINELWQFDDLIARNRSLYCDIAIVVHTIIRSDMFYVLPVELWLFIFQLLDPLPYKKLLNQIWPLYK